MLYTYTCPKCGNKKMKKEEIEPNGYIFTCEVCANKTTPLCKDMKIDVV